jgi:hypothetical protein
MPETERGDVHQGIGSGIGKDFFQVGGPIQVADQRRGAQSTNPIGCCPGSGQGHDRMSPSVKLLDYERP